MGCGTWFAILLIVIGIWIWASNYGITIFSFYRDWPILIILLGILVFLKLRRRKYWRIKKDKE
jgi:Ca2+/Na+ antiporter